MVLYIMRSILFYLRSDTKIGRRRRRHEYATVSFCFWYDFSMQVFIISDRSFIEFDFGMGWPLRRAIEDNIFCSESRVLEPIFFHLV